MCATRSLRHTALAAAAIALLTLGGCRSVDGTPFVLPGAPVDAEAIGIEAVQYDLGETTIVQSVFPEESRFRHMPVRLNGVIAVPESAGPHPVVVIFHGTHPGCPIPEGDTVDRWPCAPEAEQPNYLGFDYLVRALAAQGYVALAPNINAENTFGFGEPQPGERLRQLAALHLRALAGAAAGGPQPFGVDVEGRADLGRLAFFGHSRGAEAAYVLAHDPEWAAGTAGDTAAPAIGPVAGLLLVAPSPVFVLPAQADMPLAVLLPACDGDVREQSGQLYYEGVRLAPVPNQRAASLWLERANHNAFNELLAGDPFGTPNRPDCDPLLDPEAQRAALVAVAADFLTAIFDSDPAAAGDARARLGLDAALPAPGELYGLAARVASMAPAADRLPLFIPASAAELTINLAGGAVAADGVTTFFCDAGYYTPAMKPGSEPCKRVNLTIPGNPAMVVMSWEEPGAALRLALAGQSGDVSRFMAFSLRAALDPLAPLNAPGATQAFSVQLTDRAGNTAVARTRPDEPALQFPPGAVEEDEIFAGGLFSGLVPMTTVRVQLRDFSGVDLSQVREVALLFDQTPGGALFLGDLEFVR